MDDKLKLRKNPNIVHRVIGDETVLVPVLKTNKEMNCIYTLNKPAAFVWEMLDGKMSLAKIKSEILEKFDVTEQDVDKELSNLLKDLDEAGAICGK